MSSDPNVTARSFTAAPDTTPVESSASDQFDWSKPVGVWGPDDAMGHVVTGNDRPPRQWGMVEVAVGYLLAVFSGLPVIALWIAATWDPTQEVNDQTVQAALDRLIVNPPFLLASLVMLWAVFFFVPLWATYRKGAHSMATDFWLTWKWRYVPLGLGIAVALRAMDLAVSWFATAVLGLDGEKLGNTDFLTDATSPLLLTAMILGAAVGAPIFEEVFFRGMAFQGATRKWGPTAGVIVSSVMFGALHLQTDAGLPGAVYLITMTGLLGAVLAAVTWRTKTLTTAVVIHVGFNSSGVALALLMA